MVAATFIMHLSGYLAVLIVLQLAGISIHWFGVILAVPVLLLLFVFACGFTLFSSALQVFVRDVAQILPPMMTFWFFTTPILYSLSILPPGLAALFEWNPMTWFVVRLRSLILFGDFQPAWTDLFLLLLSVSIFWLGLKFFRRFAGHFEDFL